MGSKSMRFREPEARSEGSFLHFSVLGFHDPNYDNAMPDVTYVFKRETADLFFEDDKHSAIVVAGALYETHISTGLAPSFDISLLDKFGNVHSKWIPPLEGEAKKIVSNSAV